MKSNKTERGQSLVEFAISLTIILFLLAGAVEFGMALFQYIQLRDAAQEGALYGSICPHNPATSDAIEQRVRNASNAPLDLTVTSGPNAVTVTVEGRDGNTGTVKTWGSLIPGDGVYVEASYNHQIFMPFVPEFIGSETIPISVFVIDTILDTDTTKPECQ